MIRVEEERKMAKPDVVVPLPAKLLAGGVAGVIGTSIILLVAHILSQGKLLNSSNGPVFLLLAGGHHRAYSVRFALLPCSTSPNHRAVRLTW